jgi:putative copper resistance protein D
MARGGGGATPAPGSDAGSRDNVLVHLRRRPAFIAIAASVASLSLPAIVHAHGGGVPPEPTVASFLLGWSFDPLIWLPVGAAALLWRIAVGRVRAAHPGNPVPRRRSVAWALGLLAILVALDSGIERYDTTLFSVHMVQHLLLTMVAPPLLLYAGPITLLLRVSSPETRRRWILPFLHARAVRVLAFPVVAWILFAGVMWASHFSPLFDAALENELWHRVEHGLFLGSALLFWWPAVGVDPSPWRLGPAVRVLYVGLQMPQNTFLALAIYWAGAPLYNHYATSPRTWGPTPLEDQQIAGGIMWLGGDLLFLAAVAALMVAWMRHEDRRSVGEDRRLEGDRAAIRAREMALAERLAAERDGAAADGEGPGPLPSPQPSGGTGASSQAR